MSTQPAAEVPTLDAFLAAPIEQSAAVAPATVIVGANSAQLTAAFAGIEPNSREYAQLAQTQLIECITLLFQHGVRNVVPFVMNANLQDDQRYRSFFTQWVEMGTAGPGMQALYAARGWRARLVGTESLPELIPVAERLKAATPDPAEHTLWWSIAANTDATWSMLIAAAQRAQASTQAELIHAIYGEDIPPATMFVGFGKPLIAPSFVALPLVGDMQCYWSQRPGFGLDAPMLRRMLYDYAYVRHTRVAGDRSGRYADLGAQRAAWETDAVLGVGQSLGSFWYPAPFPAVEGAES